jgi:hypothetical protein
MVWYFIAYCVGLLTAFAFADIVKEFVRQRRLRRPNMNAGPLIGPEEELPRITLRLRDGREVPLTIRKDWK